MNASRAGSNSSGGLAREANIASPRARRFHKPVPRAPTSPNPTSSVRNRREPGQHLVGGQQVSVAHGPMGEACNRSIPALEPSWLIIPGLFPMTNFSSKLESRHPGKLLHSGKLNASMREVSYCISISQSYSGDVRNAVVIESFFRSPHLQR